MRLSEISEKIEKFISQGVWLNNAFDVWNETEGKNVKDRLQSLADYIAVTTGDKDSKETIYSDIEADFIDKFGKFDPDMVNDENVEELLLTFDDMLDTYKERRSLYANAGGGGGGGGGAGGGGGGAGGGAGGAGAGAGASAGASSGGNGGSASSGGDGGSADSGSAGDSATTSSDSTSSDAPVSRGFYGIGTMAPYKKSKKKKKKKKKASYKFGQGIYEAIEKITPCPKTKSKGCQCERVNRIAEAEETVKAIATLEHAEDNVEGMFKFVQKPGNATFIQGIVKGITPGKHGLHIHEYGDLSDGCDSAGAHYNPEGVDHGGLQEGHVGDLGNIIADKSGVSRFQIKAERVNLSDVVGRAIVVHADEDDLGKGGDEESLKTGNAGDRLGCGVIRLREVVEENYNRGVSDKHFDRNQLPQIRRNDIVNDSEFDHKEGMISLDKLKPVQSQRVKGLSKKAEDVFLKKADRPFIIDKKGYIINGHHRYDAANILGIKRVPAIMIDADIEDVMQHFAHTTSNKKVMAENYFKNLLAEKVAKLNEIQTTTEYVNTTELGDYIKQYGGSDKVSSKVSAALNFFQSESMNIFYKIEAEQGYSVNGKPLEKSIIRRLVPKSIPDDVVGIWIAKNISPKGTKLKPNWSWKQNPKLFTQHQDMIKLRKVVQDNIQKALNDGDVPITIQHFDQDDEMAPLFRLNINTNEGKLNEVDTNFPDYVIKTDVTKFYKQFTGEQHVKTNLAKAEAFIKKTKQKMEQIDDQIYATNDKAKQLKLFDVEDKLKLELSYVDGFYRNLKVQYEGYGAKYWTKDQLKQFLNIKKGEIDWLATEPERIKMAAAGGPTPQQRAEFEKTVNTKREDKARILDIVKYQSGKIPLAGQSLGKLDDKAIFFLQQALPEVIKGLPGTPLAKMAQSDLEVIKTIKVNPIFFKSDIKNEGKRIPRKKGQPAGSKKHSDLYTDENPKGTIKGLKFATVKDAKASVSKIRSSGKKHAHKIQAAIAMEQRAKAAGKKSAAAVYRKYINQMKKKTKKMNEGTRCWKGYKKKGTKMMFGKRVPNCVKNESTKNEITHRELASIIYKYTKNLQLAKDFDNLEDEFVSQNDLQSIGLSGMDQDPLEYDRERVNKILSMHRVPVKVVKMKQDNQYNTIYTILQTVATNEGEVVDMNPQAKKPFFSPEEADRANDEWVNQAQVDQEDGVIVRGTDDKQYRIMTSYNNEHFEDGEVYLDGLTDPTYIDPDGYPDAAELLYYHSATGHYPKDPDEIDENFKDGKVKGKSRPGRVKRAGASCKGSVTSLRKKAKNSSGEKAKMYHWCANMKSGRKKS